MDYITALIALIKALIEANRADPVTVQTLLDILKIPQEDRISILLQSLQSSVK